MAQCPIRVACCCVITSPLARIARDRSPSRAMQKCAWKPSLGEIAKFRKSGRVAYTCASVIQPDHQVHGSSRNRYTSQLATVSFGLTRTLTSLAELHAASQNISNARISCHPVLDRNPRFLMGRAAFAKPFLHALSATSWLMITSVPRYRPKTFRDDRDC